MIRKLIAFDDETWHAVMQLGRDRMGDLQELADEAFADLLVKHGVPKSLKDALRKSAAAGKRQTKKTAKSAAARKSARPGRLRKKRASASR
jgi:hypothetical protein